MSKNYKLEIMEVLSVVIKFASNAYDCFVFINQDSFCFVARAFKVADALRLLALFVEECHSLEEVCVEAHLDLGNSLFCLIKINGLLLDAVRPNFAALSVARLKVKVKAA